MHCPSAVGGGAIVTTQHHSPIAIPRRPPQLRVGGEKDEDEADTVGCCSLRVEHLKFDDSATAACFTLDFLGKDSMRYFQTIDVRKRRAREGGGGNG